MSHTAFITLAETMQVLHSDNFFSVKFVTFNKKKPADNGRIKFFEYCKLERFDKDKKTTDGVKTPDKLTNSTASVRNVRIYNESKMPTILIIAVHPTLILEVNNRKLLL